jgi:hypothetical protein
VFGVHGSEIADAQLTLFWILPTSMKLPDAAEDDSMMRRFDARSRNHIAMGSSSPEVQAHRALLQASAVVRVELCERFQEILPRELAAHLASPPYLGWLARAATIPELVTPPRRSRIARSRDPFPRPYCLVPRLLGWHRPRQSPSPTLREHGQQPPSARGAVALPGTAAHCPDIGTHAFTPISMPLRRCARPLLRRQHHR